MARILMINLPYSGHTNPTLGLAEELVKRGHEVGYINSPVFREKIEATGAVFITYDDYPENLTDQQVKTHCFMAAYNTGMRVGKEYDLILYELLFYLGKLLSENLGKPCIRQFSTFAWNNHVASTFICKSPMWYIFAFKSLRKLITRICSYGVKLQYGDLINEISNNVPGQNIVYTSKEFQIYSEEFDEKFHFVGPSISTRINDAKIPFEEMKETIIYVSMGTVFGKKKKIYQNCIEAFAGEDVSVIMSIGKYIKKESLGDIPSNFYVFEHVPQLEVLKRASLFITHGGMNSVNESIYYCVPMLVSPLGSDQPTVADRVEELGMGIRIRGNQISSRRLRDLSKRIIMSKEYNENTIRHSHIMKQAGGITKAADLVEETLKKF